MHVTVFHPMPVALPLTIDLTQMILYLFISDNTMNS
jgi:hypothetical protein